MVVVGTTGSGKTSLARAVAQIAGIPHVELDALHWDPGWTAADSGIFRERVEHTLRGSQWITDGNYSKVQDIVWVRADTLIWLDYTLPVILSRLLRRTATRVMSREELWNGNRESWRDALSRDSILFWALKTYRKRRRDIPEMVLRPQYSHLQVIRLRTPLQADQWLEAEIARFALKNAVKDDPLLRRVYEVD